MLRFSRSQRWLIHLVCVLGVYFSLPTLLPESWRSQSWMPSQHLSLGLDLRGGAQLLIAVDAPTYFQDQLDQRRQQLRHYLRDAKVPYRKVFRQKEALLVQARDADEVVDLQRAIAARYEDMTSEVLDDHVVSLRYSEEARGAMVDRMVEQSLEIIRRRIDASGTREPVLQRQAGDRILVQIPGFEDPALVRQLLGKTAKLALHLVADEGMEASESFVLPGQRADERYRLDRRVLLTGDRLVDAHLSFQEQRPVVSFAFDREGGRRFGEITTAHRGKQLAMVLDGKVLSAPVISEPIMGGAGVISGRFSTAEASELALLLRSGALPAPLLILEERRIGPSMGQDSIDAGVRAAWVGFVAVILFMVWIYGVLGVFASLALVVNIFLMLGIMTLLQATLTMPAIAGLVLTLGMAVDANVLIFERIREELRHQNNILTACDRGFRHAYTAIVDSNITTAIVAIILYMVGSGPVAGFAVMFLIGLVSSMFTAITVTRLWLVDWVRRSGSVPSSLKPGRLEH